MYDGIKRQAEMQNKAGLPFSIGQQKSAKRCKKDIFVLDVKTEHHTQGMIMADSKGQQHKSWRL